MRRKIGELTAYDSVTNKTIKIIIWGWIFRGGNKKLIGGFHFNMNYEKYLIFLPYIQQMMGMCDDLQVNKYDDMYSMETKWKVKAWGDLEQGFDLDNILNSIKLISDYEDERYKYNLNIYKDCEFLIDSKVIEDL